MCGAAAYAPFLKYAAAAIFAAELILAAAAALVTLTAGMYDIHTVISGQSLLRTEI